MFLTSFILALRAAVLAKLVILGISPLILFILSLRLDLVAKFVISDILSSIFLILALHSVFLKTLFFNILLSLLKSNEVVSIFPVSNSSSLLYKLLKPLGTFFNLSISNLTTLGFK